MNGAIEIYNPAGSRAEGGAFDPAIYEQAKRIVEDGATENTKQAYRSDLGYYIAGRLSQG